MKTPLVCLAVVCLFFPALGGDSVSRSSSITKSDRAEIFSVFSELQRLPYDFVFYLDSLVDNGKEVGNKELREIIFESLGRLSTEEFLQGWAKKIDSGSQLESTDNFSWAIPSLPSEYYRFYIRKKAGSSGSDEAEVVCIGKTPDRFSMLGSDFCLDSADRYPKVKNPWSKKYQSLPWKSVYKTIFSFKKTSSGWKLSGFAGEDTYSRVAGQ